MSQAGWGKERAGLDRDVDAKVKKFHVMVVESAGRFSPVTLSISL